MKKWSVGYNTLWPALVILMTYHLCLLNYKYISHSLANKKLNIFPYLLTNYSFFVLSFSHIFLFCFHQCIWISWQCNKDIFHDFSMWCRFICSLSFFFLCWLLTYLGKSCSDFDSDLILCFSFMPLFLILRFVWPQ